MIPSAALYQLKKRLEQQYSSLVNSEYRFVWICFGFRFTHFPFVPISLNYIAFKVCLMLS